MGIKKVYKASDRANAYLFLHQLEAAGIRGIMRGEALMSLGGEIPLYDALPSIWVNEEDMEQATEILRQFEGPALVFPKWHCTHCGEENEANFGQCWNCLNDRPA